MNRYEQKKRAEASDVKQLIAGCNGGGECSEEARRLTTACSASANVTPSFAFPIALSPFATGGSALPLPSPSPSAPFFLTWLASGAVASTLDRLNTTRGSALANTPPSPPPPFFLTWLASGALASTLNRSSASIANLDTTGAAASACVSMPFRGAGPFAEGRDCRKGRECKSGWGGMEGREGGSEREDGREWKAGKEGAKDRRGKDCRRGAGPFAARREGRPGEGRPERGSGGQEGRGVKGRERGDGWQEREVSKTEKGDVAKVCKQSLHSLSREARSCLRCDTSGNKLMPSAHPKHDR